MGTPFIANWHVYSRLKPRQHRQYLFKVEHHSLIKSNNYSNLAIYCKFVVVIPRQVEELMTKFCGIC